MTEQTTHHNWSHLNCLRSCPHHHSACHSRDKRDYSDSGNFWWVGTGSFLNDRKEGVYSLSSPCINKYFPCITNKTLPMYCKHLLGKLIIFIFYNSTVCVCMRKRLLLHSSGFSSELSPQSSSPSHFQDSGLHRVLLHWNSSWGQCRATEREQKIF